MFSSTCLQAFLQLPYVLYIKRKDNTGIPGFSWLCHRFTATPYSNSPFIDMEKLYFKNSYQSYLLREQDLWGKDFWCDFTAPTTRSTSD